MIKFSQATTQFIFVGWFIVIEIEVECTDFYVLTNLLLS